MCGPSGLAFLPRPSIFIFDLPIGMTIAHPRLSFPESCRSQLIYLDTQSCLPDRMPEWGVFSQFCRVVPHVSDPGWIPQPHPTFMNVKGRWLFVSQPGDPRRPLAFVLESTLTSWGLCVPTTYWHSGLCVAESRMDACNQHVSQRNLGSRSGTDRHPPRRTGPRPGFCSCDPSIRRSIAAARRRSTSNALARDIAFPFFARTPFFKKSKGFLQPLR